MKRACSISGIINKKVHVPVEKSTFEKNGSRLVPSPPSTLPGTTTKKSTKENTAKGKHTIKTALLGQLMKLEYGWLD